MINLFVSHAESCHERKRMSWHSTPAIALGSLINVDCDNTLKNTRSMYEVGTVCNVYFNCFCVDDHVAC